MTKFRGLGERLGARLRLFGYWKRDRPDVLRFCREKGYRPQYVYAWLKDRVPSYANLRRLAADLDVSMAWIMFGKETGDIALAPPQALRAAGGGVAPARPPATAPLRPPSATGVAVWGTPEILDVRRLREVMDRLVQLEAEMHAIFLAFPDGYFWLDRDGTVIAFRAGRGFNMPVGPERFLGRRLEDLLPAHVAGPLRHAIKRALGGEGVVAVESRLVVRERERTFETRMVTLPAPLDGDRRVLAIVRDITERQRSEAAARALVETGRDVAGTLDLAQVAQRIATTVVRLFGVRGACLYRVGRAAESLTCEAVAGVPELGRWIGESLPLEHSVAGRAVRERQPVACVDLFADPRIVLPDWAAESLKAAGIGAAVSVPLVAGGEVLGALTLAEGPGRAFDEDDLHLLAAFADDAALALQTARLYSEAERGRHEVEVVAALARDITGSLDIDTVLPRTVAAARELCESDAAWIALREPGSSSLVFRYEAGVPRMPDVRVEPGKGLGGQVLVTGRPMRTEDYARDPRFSKDYLGAVKTDGVLAEVVVPIRVGDEIEGLLYVLNGGGRPFGDRDEAVLARLADHAAVAIRNASLYAQAEQRRQSAEGLREIARLLALSLDPAVVAQRVADCLLALLQVRASAVFRLDPGSGEPVAIAWAGARRPLSAAGTALLRAVGLSGLAVREARSAQTPDFLADPRIVLSPEVRALLEQAGSQSALAVPLVAHGDLIGTLIVGDRAGRAYGDEEVRLAESFADQAALALENARLFEENRRALAELRGSAAGISRDG